MEKRVLKFIFVIVFVLIFLKQISAGLGVSPGKVEINFQPNQEIKIPYHVSEDDPTKELSISFDGELGKYGKLSTNKLVGSGDFFVTLNLPEEMDKPGKNVLYVRVEEKVDDELAEGAVGTSVTIGAAIIINVPYPGRFLELNLDSNNANVGEPVDFLLDVTSKGTEDLMIQPKIEIYSDSKLIDTLEFNEREIKSQENIKLKKTLDTTGYNPGKYNAVALVDYGDDTAKAEHEFRIGELVINILNYTEKVKIGGIKAFNIGVASGWNNDIDGVYGIVSLSKDSVPITEFKTDTETLTPWEEKTIIGHFDTTNFEPGIYDANITLVYFGKDQGKSTSENAKVEFVKGINVTMVALISAIVLLIVMMVVTSFLLWRRGNGKKKKEK